MLKDLSPPQRKLADYMSELSEAAYCAGWMEDLEFALWRLVTQEAGRYGQMDITVEHTAKLRELSAGCNGWIVFDDKSEETFVLFDEWLRRYTERIQSGRRLIT